MTGALSLLLRNRFSLSNARRVMREQSRFKILFLAAFGVLFMAGISALFLDGFRFLDSIGGAGVIVLNRLFSLFFLGLGAMLIISSAVTSYATLYRSDEVPFLLVRPFSVTQVVVYKFLESTFWSCWAFFLIIIPFLAAYAWYQKLSLVFTLWTFIFSIPFLVFCSGVGALLTLAVIRWVPRGRYLRALALGLGGLAMAILVFRGPSLRGINFEEQSTFALAGIIPGFTVAACPLLPNWWIAEGILSVTSERWFRGVMLWGVTVSNMLVIVLLVEWVGSRVFYAGYQRMTGAGGVTRRRATLLPGLGRLLACLRPDTRAVIMKDLRTFLRDPAQWSQVLIYFGLLTLYYLNLRTLRYHKLPDVWKNLIAFLNIFSVTAVLCSLSSRFVYPQLSLEGQGFWLVGLAPTTVTRLLRAKFLLALTATLTVSLGLVGLSSWMLDVQPLIKGIAVLLAVAISFAMSGLSVGLGAVFIDIRQPNSAAIVSGFGGTLNLVLSLGFMLAAILPFAGVLHMHAFEGLQQPGMRMSLAIAAVWLVFVTAATTVVPLLLGARRLSRFEY